MLSICSRVDSFSSTLGVSSGFGAESRPNDFDSIFAHSNVTTRDSLVPQYETQPTEWGGPVNQYRNLRRPVGIELAFHMAVVGSAARRMQVPVNA